MRKFIDIVEAGLQTAYQSLNQFGTGSMSRATDPNQEIDFKVFGMPADVEGLKAVMSNFPNVTYTLREPTKLFAKWTLLCHGTRADAEAVSRAVKMARLSDTATRID